MSTSGLDPLLQHEFISLLEETAADGRTVFLSSHDLDEVQRTVNRLAIIKEGRIVVTDTVDGLRERAPRTVELTFDPGVDVTPITRLAGVTVNHQSPGRLALTLRGPVAPLLHVVTPLEPLDIVARPANLDELFLDYYGATEAKADADTDTASQEPTHEK
ncbi:hypothetical protein [Cryobacterium psychrophilum]|uniref:DUF4162 domain-containing protein n=1 Tax=Cryobacterium psychrophilum TaxID=41988 RepID=A0A4Y8KL84_9MICO|nr:hypothetical protein [Cryobacterium psychrophilum]TFD76796.1 hypothetical protein E3T53_13090 [Cryobacterium psychrophilum]